jgi:hypothetical protein
MLSMKQLVFAAGLLHFCQVPSMIAAPRMLRWRADLSRLEPLNRRIVEVIGLSIMIVVIGLGIVVICAPADLVGGSRLATGLTCFLGVLWLFRAIVQVGVYGRMWPGGWAGRLSHYGMSLLFFALAAVYFAAFATNLRP